MRLLFLFLFVSHATAAAAAGGGCNRRCNDLVVPYPFGFSGDCPIILDCNTTSSTALLSNTTGSPPYPVVSFNSSASTFLVSLPPSCTSRTVLEAEASLNRAPSLAAGGGGGGYGVSSHTGIFLRGGCNRTATNAGNCSVPADVMTKLLDTARCGNDSSWTCVAGSPPPATNATAAAAADEEGRRGGEFMDWDAVRASGCRETLTAAVYEVAEAGLPSLEFGVAELGWWLDGACANATVSGGGGGGRCAANATCREVETPGGALGYRCACVDDGMIGDGFAAGEGCYYIAAGSSKKNILLIILGVLAGVTAATGVLLVCRVQCRRYKAGRSSSERLAAMRLLSEAATSSGVPVYSYTEVARATNSFSHTHRLGTGAYGTVYVGKLPSSSSTSPPALVAIKRLRYRHHLDDDDDHAAAAAAQLLNEIKLISSVNHPNLVRLLGCCLDRGEQILVYEYVPNGTLSHHLLTGGNGGHGRSKLTWRARLGVAAETAAAIAYLHGMRPPIFHRDVKSSNILLDGELRPKLADFGLSRSAGDRVDGEASRSHVSTAPQGTPGYVDPEYHQSFHLSDKSDVYSFGVVLLELITAMKVVDFDRPANEVNLASLGLDRIGKGNVGEIVDPAILGVGEEWVMGSVRHVSELAFRCLAFHKDVRPSMSEVAAELCQIRDAATDSGSDGGSRPMMDIQIDLSLDGDDTVGKKATVSPVSVQEVWVSDQSTPSTNDDSMRRC